MGLSAACEARLECAVLLVSQNELFSGVGEVGGATGIPPEPQIAIISSIHQPVEPTVASLCTHFQFRVASSAQLVYTYRYGYTYEYEENTSVASMLVGRHLH